MNWKQILPLIIIILALGLFYIWLTNPNDENVRKEFLAKNPTFEVIDLGVGEGNSDFATYHIRYKKPNDETIYEYVTTYQRCSYNEWQIHCEDSK